MLSFSILLRLIPYKTMGLYSQGNAFSWKVVNRKVLALILNFSTVGRGGAYGGAFTLHNSMNLMDLPHFGEKDTFSRLQEGRSWGGRMEGCLNGGADGGAIFGIHGGAQEGRWVHIWSIFYLKKRDFFISVFVWVWKVGAPPSAPPMKWFFEISKYDMWPSTRIKNH